MNYIIEGGHRLCGETKVHGAKNSALPILSACVLCHKQSILHNCPALSDVDSAIAILDHLGCCVSREDNTIVIDSNNLIEYDIPEKLMREMRSSIVFLGAVIGRTGFARICFPGGCELGPRPIDLHLSALSKLGVEIEEDHGYLNCRTQGRLKGCDIMLSFPSVGATENILLAASTAQGTTVITNAAREPEIVDLANFLNCCGAKIFGAGEGTIIIEGVPQLDGCEYTVMPDRIVAATYMVAAAMTYGDITLKGICAEHLAAIIPVLETAGCKISVSGNMLRIYNTQRLRSVRTIRTMPYPGFPTDAQAPLMALSTIANGTSIFVENIFENRYKHVAELLRMGANIKTEGKVAVVEGVNSLHSATVTCTDLRGGASLILAALSSYGVSTIKDIYHVERGYENINETLRSLGAVVDSEL